MKINFLNIITIFLLAEVLLGCNKTISNEPEELNQLNGNWVEEYHYENYPGEISSPEGTSYKDTTKNARTIIKFEGQKITILTYPQQRHFIISGNEVRVGNFSDTMYTGTYMISKDTIIMKIKGCSNQENMYYKMEKDSTVRFTFRKSNDTLKLSVVLPRSKDRFSIQLYVSYFLWGHSFRKSEGVFVSR